MALGRRKFLVTSSAVALGLSLATLGRKREAVARGAWGELVPDPDGVLDLPEGFSYRILEDAGEMMDDGYRLPGRPDGMACFPGPDNTLILLRNHENNRGDLANGPYADSQSPPPEAYDPEGMGGVSRLVVDATSFERISSNLVLIGTVRNCAGGPSPWGWLSCEENVEIEGEYRHGYVFLCPTDAATVQPPQRIDGYGRYNHEAVAVDPSNHYAYLTEDRPDSCFYRFVPDAMDEPFVGKLQALKAVDEDEFSTWLMEVGEVVECEWVDIDTPDPDEDTLRDEAHVKGALLILRGEGIWFFAGQIYVCATIGGPLGKGQIFRLTDGDAPTLELVVRSDDAEVLDMPDNITVAPWGELFLVEDGPGDNYIRWVTAAGEVCPFGRTSLSELAGICFSPDGKAMFVNIQGAGSTLVITGPFQDEGGDGDGDTSEGTDTGESADETGTDELGEGETAGDDEVGETGAADEADGCSCSTEGEAGSPALAGLAAVALAGLVTRKPD